MRHIESPSVLNSIPTFVKLASLFSSILLQNEFPEGLLKLFLATITNGKDLLKKKNLP